MIEALKLIVAKSPNAARQALQAIAAVSNKSPVAQVRYNHCVSIALNDGQAQFTQAERALLASYLDGTDSDNRSFMLRVRLTDTERARLQDAADAAGQSMSEYVRSLLF